MMLFKAALGLGKSLPNVPRTKTGWTNRTALEWECTNNNEEANIKHGKILTNYI